MSMHEMMPLLKSLWTIWFFAMFVAAVTWALWPSRRESMERQALIPLKDGASRAPSERH